MQSKIENRAVLGRRGVAVKNNHAISFAALIRVSTDRQAMEGESLRTQRSEIERAVKQLGGLVVGWYGGQEHATPGWEKKEVARLLSDSTNPQRKFDAVIVTHPDRWSRDNSESKKGLEILRNAGVKFFVGGAEYDLFKPIDRLFLGMSAEIGEFQARQQSEKSLQNRIARARRNIPTCGKLPFGRRFDKQKGKWEIDETKQAVIESMARRYLAGESMARLAEELGVNHSSLHKTLTKRCGSTWEQKFVCDKLNINETVVTEIPALLKPEVIQAILARVAANKTYEHGKIKNHYLLGRMVFCEQCGYTYFGQTNHGERRYYRHLHAKRKRRCKSSKGWVRAEELEDAVLRHLFNTFGNPAQLERAIERALPNLDAHRRHQERLAELDALISKEKDGRQKILKLVRRNVCGMEEAEQQLKESQERIDAYEVERKELVATTSNIPTVAEVRDAAGKTAARFERVSKAIVKLNAARGISVGDFARMKWEDKHDLFKRVFAGKTPDGRRAGVYIEWPNGRGKPCCYTIRGLIERRCGELPMSEDLKEHLVDPDYSDAESNDFGLTKFASHSPAPSPRARRSCGPHREPVRLC
jgi:site-specific DNA recombinase